MSEPRILTTEEALDVIGRGAHHTPTPVSAAERLVMDQALSYGLLRGWVECGMDKNGELTIRITEQYHIDHPQEGTNEGT